MFWVRENQIVDITAVTNLIHSNYLNLYNNLIQDISPLANSTGLIPNKALIALSLNPLESRCGSHHRELEGGRLYGELRTV